MKFKKPNQMVKHKLVSFATFVALWTLVTNKANWHAFEVEIHTRQKLCHFGRYDAKAKLFCQKSFVPVTRLECSYGKDFELGYRDRGRKNRDGASPASHMNTSNFLRRKEWRVEISETKPARLNGLI